MLNHNNKTYLEAMFAVLLLCLQHAYGSDDLGEFRYVSKLTRKSKTMKTSDDQMITDQPEAWVA